MDTGLGTDSVCSGTMRSTTGVDIDKCTDNSLDNEACEPPKRKRNKIVKTEDDHVPLPNPFPLPRHYRADVEMALQKKEMTIETLRIFFPAFCLQCLHTKVPYS